MDQFLFPSFTIMRCAAADGDSMDQFLVTSTSMRSITADGDGMDQFLVLRITFISVEVIATGAFVFVAASYSRCLYTKLTF